MSDHGTKAVFLSYASQDATTVERIAAALRAAGVEVWFDQNELVGGDAWDRKIRQQIKECAVFVPVISAHTNARDEGYFRLEWKLAVDRSHLIADDRAFLLPVVIDDIADAGARVPDRFRDFQWARITEPENMRSFASQVARLTGGPLRPESSPPVPVSVASTAHAARPHRRRWGWVGLAALGAAGWVAVRLLTPAPTPAVAVKASPASTPTAPFRSQAMTLAERAFAMSVDNFNSTIDDFTTADALMKRALALEPEDGPILARAAQLNFMFRNRGFDFAPERLAIGREQAERAIRLAPDLPEALMALSLSQRYTRNLEAELETLKRLIQLEPDHGRGLLALGSALLGRNSGSDEGRAFYRRARLNPKWAPLADYFDFLGLFTRRDFAAAEVAARQGYSIQPSINGAGAIALLHLTWKGDLAAAVRELEAVPTAFFNAPRVVWLTAHVHLCRRAPDQALAVLDRIPEDFIRDSWFVGPKTLIAGRAHALAGRPNAARMAWEAGLRIIDQRLKAEPDDRFFRQARGELLAWLGRTDEALAEAQVLEEIQRGGLESWSRSGVSIYAILGRADLAIPRIEKMLAEPRANWPLTPTLLRHDPIWDPLRSDPRFARLLAENSGDRSTR